MAADIPYAKIRKRTALSFIWCIPAIAAVIAIVLVVENLQKFGPVITIQFENANGLDANQSVIRYRGVRVGSVQSIQLTRDLRNVEVRARLTRTASSLAREGSIFWIVRPEVGAAGVHALETIVSGPYIEALPGDSKGRTENHFIGADETPVITEGKGTEYILRAPFIRSLGPNSPVFYRGLQAGRVQYLELSEDSTTVKVHVLIRPGFVPLVRANTVWWNAGGIDITWHLLSGLNMTAENLKAVVTGGLSFATPNVPDVIAAPNTIFVLYEKPEDKWMDWAPRINITNTLISTPGNSPTMDLENVNQGQK